MSLYKDSYKAFMSQPAWAKAVELIGMSVVLVLSGKAIIKAIKKSKDERLQRQVVQQAGNTIRDLANQGITPSYPDSQFSAWASQIKTAFDGCDPQSDDYDTVVRIMEQMKNDADVYKLIQSFGTQTWDECGWWTGDVTGDLAYGIAHEINGISDINEILSKRGIKFKF